MNNKTAVALLSISMLAAGCSSSGQTNTEETDKTPELIEAVVNSASDDQKALEAWDALLLNTASAYNYQFEMETDGEDYEYKQDDAEGNVDDSAVYETGKEVLFRSSSENESYVFNVASIEDSDENFLKGFGIIDRFGEQAIQIALDIQDPDLEHFRATVADVFDNSGTLSEVTRDEAISNAMMDAMANTGYVVSSDPFHNASYYEFSVKKDADGYVMNVTAKDLDAIRMAANSRDVLYDYRSQRPVLGMNEIENESWEFRFDDQGVLKECTANAGHVLYALDAGTTETWLSIMNRTTIEKLENEKIMDELPEVCNAISADRTAGTEITLGSEVTD